MDMAILGSSKGAGELNLEARFVKWQFKISAARRARFYEMMSSLIADGMPLDASLRQLGVRYKEKKRPMAKLLKAWLSAMNEGKSFAEASRGFVSDTETIIISAGEKSGDLVTAFEQASLVARASADITRAVRSEMATPVTQLVLLVFLLIGFSTSIAPELVKSVPHSALDGSQQLLFGLAGVVAGTWYFVLPVVLTFAWAAYWSMPRYVGPCRTLMDKLPPWSVYKVYAGSTFMISLAALIKAGVPIEAAIRFIRAQASPWMRDHLTVMVGRLRSGADQGSAMDVGLLSDDIADLVAIYAKTTAFDSAVNSVGREAIKSGIENIKAKAGLARTLSTLLMGLMIGWMFISMMNISDAAQRANRQQQQGAPSR